MGRVANLNSSPTSIPCQSTCILTASRNLLSSIPSRPRPWGLPSSSLLATLQHASCPPQSCSQILCSVHERQRGSASPCLCLTWPTVPHSCCFKVDATTTHRCCISPTKNPEASVEAHHLSAATLKPPVIHQFTNLYRYNVAPRFIRPQPRSTASLGALGLGMTSG